MATLALIIPACDEAAVIGQILDGLPPGMFSQVIVAVNGSRDATVAIARAHGAIVVEIPERGYGAACLAATPLLEAEIVVFLQADGSEDAGETPALVAPLLDGSADLVLGSRTLGHALPGALLAHQRFGNQVATALIRFLFGHTYSDLGPFRALRTSTLRQLGMRDRNFGWTVEMQVRALQQRLRVIEIPVTYGLRQAGEPKVAGRWDASLQAGWVILSTVWRLWWAQ